jgi:hypothetical protein
VPLALIRTTEARFKSLTMTPEECYYAQPVGQLVQNIRFDLQFSKAVDKWRAAGCSLRIGAVALGGHAAAIENCHTTNYGALGKEAFIYYIQGAYGMYDRNLIAQLDPTKYIFDEGQADVSCAHVVNGSVDGYSTDSDPHVQVTVQYIAGSIGETSPGVWRETMRAYAYQRGGETLGSLTSNMIQPHTIYQVLRGKIDRNYALNTACGVYGDSYTTKGLEIQFNEFLGVYHAIQLQLSPGDPDDPESLKRAAQFSMEKYKIGPHKIASRAENVLLDPMGEQTDTRYIRDFDIDSTLTVKNGGATDVRQTGVLASRRGCRKFF